MSFFPEHGLYCLTDSRLAGKLSHVQQARLCIGGGANIIQLRDKARVTEGPDRRMLLDDARAIATLCREHGVVFIVNDDPQLAVEVGADGVHVGQDDVAAEEARRIVGPERIVGLSTHNRRQVIDAQTRPVDYIGFGPVFATTTKDAGAPLGPAQVRWAVRHSALPVVAIGGIDHGNLPSLIAVGVRLVAVISAIVGAEDVAAAARAMTISLREPDDT